MRRSHRMSSRPSLPVTRPGVVTDDKVGVRPWPGLYAAPRLREATRGTERDENAGDRDRGRRHDRHEPRGGAVRDSGECAAPRERATSGDEGQSDGGEYGRKADAERHDEQHPERNVVE